MGFKPLTYNTAPEEEAHIFAEDDAAIFQSIFGEDGVFAIGDRMKATVINNNQVRVGNGILCVGGHIGRTVYGDYSDMTIENGEISKNRNDIITAVFSTTGEKGIDKFKIEVKKGTPGVVAEDPELTKENLYEGGKLREFPLWRVKLEGINIIEVEQMFKIIPKIADLEKMIESLNGKCYKNISDGANESVYQIGNEINVIGTMVKRSGGDYIALFSEAQLQKWFGDNYDYTRLNIATSNGDDATAATRLYAPERWNDGSWFQYFYPRYVGPIRINYRITYKVKG